MNQILVTKKLYITPELRRKKRIYKIRFFLSIFAICLLFSYYIYAEYDKNKSEEVSKQILTHISSKTNEEDTTVRTVVNDVLIVSLDATVANEIESVPIVETEDEYVDTTNNEEYKSEAILKISSLGLEYPVLSQTSEELLKISLNKYWGPGPNEIGNYCIVGHNYKNGKMFGNLSKMEIGDTATLQAIGGKDVIYEVYDKYVVEPEDVSCTSQLTGGRRELTLITCTNYGTQRLVLKCREI
ncbi:MAG: sortase [Christensenellales bacterium]